MKNKIQSKILLIHRNSRIRVVKSNCFSFNFNNPLSVSYHHSNTKRASLPEIKQNVTTAIKEILHYNTPFTSYNNKPPTNLCHIRKTINSNAIYDARGARCHQLHHKLIKTHFVHIISSPSVQLRFPRRFVTIINSFSVLKHEAL